ncbi:hypothetical protein [Rubellimicrobium aerolatum]|uniref:DUF4435 domain-containing protein n=1 Tax=Rubellimicrobium aerolatum TaxID=490979 RepID=A0ABW0S9P7_9RHOB|nr:hypothetical protein [Rubellimicrobium aerolatum]MBP1805029.1 hypothetical protein [Rubellimicrobium aerolatum]
MIFSRTADGLSAEHRFYEADVVLYCEGSSKEDGTSSLDELFWSEVMAARGQKVFCKSFGCKADLIALAGRIFSGNVARAIVALDRDYDWLLSEQVEHPCVLYSYGYSWESDLPYGFSFGKIMNLFFTVVDTSRLEQSYYSFMQSSDAQLRRLCLIDVRYRSAPVQIFDRSKPASLVASDTTGGRALRASGVVSKCRATRFFEKVQIRQEQLHGRLGRELFFGKTVLKLAYQWFVGNSKSKSSGRSVTYDTFCSALILNMQHDGRGGQRDAYFDELVQRWRNYALA